MSEWFFPYPSEAVDRFGFIVGDLISLGVLALIVLPTVIALTR